MLHIIYIHCTLHNFLLHVYESNKTIGMFNGKFADEGDNSVKNPSNVFDYIFRRSKTHQMCLTTSLDGQRPIKCV